MRYFNIYHKKGFPAIGAIHLGTSLTTLRNLDTNMACMIYDRKETVVEFGYEDGNNLRKGLVTIKADRRLAFAIERPSGIVGGDLTVTKPKAEGGESDKGTQGGQGGAG